MRALRLLQPVRTPSGFAVLTLVTLALMWVIIPSGAIVRLTDSGLGCPDWPTCEGTITSVTTGHALIEYTNRILSGVVGVAAVVTWIVGWWAPGAPRAVRGLSAALALCAGAQIPLGAVTVASGLHPMAVGSHFLLSIVALTAAVLLALAARDWRDGRERRWDLRRGVLAGGVSAAALVVLVTGVVVTAAGPHSGDDDVLRRWGDLALAARVHVRAAMVFTALAVVLVAWVIREGGIDRLTARLMWIALPLVALQIGIGEYQYRNGLPWQAVVLHVTVAAAVWAVIAGAAYGVARPAGAAYARREADRWQDTQRTASGSALSRPSEISSPQSTQIP
ncbi:MAG TPA: COX15/CtaA family protein [Miltoncostaeaceae bacterium]|nr:COX15/CtaA family protein [Miltoncostaeaceae bacterium]